MIRVIPSEAATLGENLDVITRLYLFDATTGWQHKRETEKQQTRRANARGWTREELYERD